MYGITVLFWAMFGVAAGLNWGGTFATGKLRRLGYIICRQEKLADFCLIVACDIILVVDFAVANNWSVVPLTVLYWFGCRFSWRIYLRHRDHDDDCFYGPRRRKMLAGTRLKMFWKPRVLVAPA